MLVSKTRLWSSSLLLGFLLLGAGASPARADKVVISPFYPRADFHHERGYFRTQEGHYYHYDQDRDGWHYGRNHKEGLRYERRHRAK